jgi:NAD(P)-dependent dehydrogenase (short-subunit alcohol dehydrogenase family)
MLKQDLDSGRIRGSIVSVSSLAGLNASPGLSAYCSTKHAIIAMVKTDALDYGPHGIRVNAICPGPTETEAFSNLVNEQQKAVMGRAIPMQRVGTSEDMGNAIVFLSSHCASYIHGVTLNVDGGSFIRKIYFNKETW